MSEYRPRLRVVVEAWARDPRHPRGDNTIWQVRVVERDRERLLGRFFGPAGGPPMEALALAHGEAAGRDMVVEVTL